MAANKHATAAERAYHLAEVARLWLRGNNHQAIATARNVSRVQITHDMQKLIAEWRENHRDMIDRGLVEQLAKIDHLEATYWDAWEKSCLDRETSTTEQIKADTDRIRASVRHETGQGNPAYLMGVERCIERRCKLLGFDAPTKIARTNTEGDDVYGDLSYGEAYALAMAIVERAGSDGTVAPVPAYADDEDVLDAPYAVG